MGTTIAEKKNSLQTTQSNTKMQTDRRADNQQSRVFDYWVLKKHESDSKFQRKIISPDETTLHLGV